MRKSQGEDGSGFVMGVFDFNHLDFAAFEATSLRFFLLTPFQRASPPFVRPLSGGKSPPQCGHLFTSPLLQKFLAFPHGSVINTIGPSPGNSFHSGIPVC